MTKTPQIPNDRDDVLWAFDKECPTPTAAQIIEWSERFPQFAEDIRDFAAVSRDCAAQAALPEEPVDEALLQRGFSQVLNLLHQTESTTAASSQPNALDTFQKSMQACGIDLPRLAQQMDIARGVLSALFNGRMQPPVGRRLVIAVMQHLRLTEATFNEYLQRALDSPKLGQAKATGTPSVSPRPYEEIVRESSMSDERKKFWLGED